MGHAPIKNTCPDIDKIIKSIEAARKMCDQKRDLEVDEYKDILSDIAYELYGLDREMENLRKDNSTLRDWGHEESDRADKMEEELEELKSQITL